MVLQLDATKPVKISVSGKDAEGNLINLTGTDLVLEAEPAFGNFGEINDEMDTFNPGEAGAVGVIRGSVTVADVLYTAEVGVELVPGGLTSIALEFTPVEGE